MTFDKLRGRFIVALIIGALVFLGISAYGDFGKVAHRLGDFRWQFLPLILLLTSLNYVLRFFKWQYYLRIIGVHDFPVRESALTYYSGLGMVVTPGKVGEWLKCYLLRELHGTPFSRSAPIVIAERLTDMLGLVILGSVGLFAVGNSNLLAKLAFPVSVVCVLILVVFARHQPLAYWVLHRLERLPLLSKVAHHAEDFYDSSYALLSPTALGSMTLLSVVSWGFEVLGFYFVMIGLGLHGGGDLLLKASFIWPAGTLVGATVGLITPGGLGVTEAGVTGLSQAILELSRDQATVGTLVIRFGTLWFGVIVGLIALALVTPMLRRRQASAETPGEPVVPEGVPAP